MKHRRLMILLGIAVLTVPVGLVLQKVLSSYLLDRMVEEETREGEYSSEDESLSYLGTSLAEGSPAYTEAQVRAWVAEVLPLVEEAAGRSFLAKPEVKLANRAELAASLRLDLALQMEVLGSLSAAGDEMTDSMAHALSIALLGKYGMVDKCTYLAPGNVEPLFKLMDVDDEMVIPIAKLIVAHELTHALQDQHIDLAAHVRTVEDVEAAQALNATIEGHAVFVQDAVGRALDLDDAVLELSRLLASGAIETGDPAMDLYVKMVAEQFNQIYLGGRDFMTYHFNEGGHERQWEVLASPPGSTRVIAHPETYGHAVESALDYPALVDGLDPMFGDRPWVAQNMEIGRIMLQSMFRVVAGEQAAELADHIQHAQALILTDPQTGEMAFIAVMILDPARDAIEFFNTLDGAVRRNLEAMSSGPSAFVTGFSVQPFTAVKSDAAHHIHIETSHSGVASSQEIVRIVRGRLMLEVQLVRLHIEQEHIAEIIMEVLRRYGEAADNADDAASGDALPDTGIDDAGASSRCWKMLGPYWQCTDVLDHDPHLLAA